MYIEGDGGGQEPPTVRERRRDRPRQGCFRPPQIPAQHGKGKAQVWTARCEWLVTGQREANPAP